MATLREGKAIGAAASVLLLIGFGTNPGNFLAIFLGLVLLLVSAKNVSEQTGDKVYTDIQWAVVFLITGAVVGFVVVFSALSSLVNFGSGSLDLASFTETVVIGLIVVSVFFIIAAIFTRRSYNAIARKLGVNLFRTAGTLFLVGAVLIMALGIGFIIIFAAIGVQLAAFLSLPDEARPRTPIDPWGKPLSPGSPAQPIRP
jgi:uncharacterized membrane protein